MRKKLIRMSIISTSLTVPGQPSPRFHVEAWLPSRNREMDLSLSGINWTPGSGCTKVG